MAEADLKLAFSALTNKAAGLSKLWAYYDGEQPLEYSTERLNELFRGINVRFNENWCSVVVDSVLDRLHLSGFDSQNARVKAVLDSVLDANGFVLDAHDAHKTAAVTGEAFIVAWNEGDIPEMYVHDPRMCALFYDPDRPKVKRFAAKWWKPDDKSWMMRLYYPERVELYAAKSENPNNASAFKWVKTDENLYGKVPVFHLRATRRAGKGSQLTNIITLQDAINKLIADMMVAAEYGAFKQRYVISNADVATLKNSPNMIWNIPAGDGSGQETQVGQFEETDLDGYLSAIDKLAAAISIISKTPKHYFMATGSNLSGDALIALEAPLVSKAKHLIEAYTGTWVELAEFLAELGGAPAKPGEIKAIWQAPETIQPLAQAQARQLNVAAGIPLREALRMEGKARGEIEQIEKARKVDLAGQASLAKAVMEKIRAEDAARNPEDEGGDA